MQDFTRRSLLQGGTALAATGMLTGPALFDFARAWAQSAPWKAEPGAKLTVMRWKRFVPAEDDAFNQMVAAFKAATGTEMNVFSESFEDVQPKASVAANTGSGLDLAWGLHTLPQLFPTKVLKMNDVADYLGKKYGGWTDAAAKTCKLGDDWLGIPVATNGGYMTYRKSALDKAGFKEFPKDFPGFLEMCKALKANNTPAGFALGHASGDGNSWLHWVLWGHGAYTVDQNDKIIINSPETAKALEYCKALYESFIPGTASWNDSSNNKAYLAGELYCTANGISIYVAAKTDATKKELTEDTYHALWPVGPVGKPTELQLALPILAFNFTKYPNASKAFVAFMLEKENYEKWLDGAQGYLTQTLNAYESAPIWTADPKNAVFSQASKRTLPAAGIGTVGEKAATAIADFIVVDMFANYCTGAKDAKGAMAEAERQLKRIYR
ncbi:multiple sugar transport system substrate-binding protein [Bradyrhizobium huanghuaihaiense]|uniref:Carbohydrate ABC transporter substrate-binding protein (CUT1 family) n=1 Tax=Bradyrhizobium huanghuaihaiense TaxID=990078 RepID=A0A562RS86_9BRAD|nr:MULTISPECIES: ABC transporter substrate-binding protein [Bradyrhizobium]TWI71941.1 carbohydrate ABC transporter substrate-binding protein (CUT1 family) [Bradyrhizobium huanghuaihaiense]UWU73637.1 extracellular solute-binding protein [Bradyrhizobium sp. CB3035]